MEWTVIWRSGGNTIAVQRWMSLINAPTTYMWLRSWSDLEFVLAILLILLYSAVYPYGDSDEIRSNMIS